MLDKPALSDDAVAASLHADYGVTAVAIEFLPLGYDNDTWVYRVDADDGRAYFLKLKRATTAEVLALVVELPRALRAGGLDWVVASLPTSTAAPWGTVGEFVTLLYPFIEARSGWEVGLTIHQWAEFGAILHHLHAVELPAELTRRLPRERFVPLPSACRLVETLLDRPAGGAGDEWGASLAVFVGERRKTIRHLLRRAADLGRRLQERHGPFVLCHGDIHVANVLIDMAGGLWIVEWDQPVLAPRERDLMFVLGATFRGVAAGSAEEAAFWAGYGTVEVDPVALAFYRYDWALQDITAFAAVLVGPDNVGAASKEEALRMLAVVFAPGGIVEAAERSEERLPKSRGMGTED
jgi:spectinomycin phosphotransferase